MSYDRVKKKEFFLFFDFLLSKGFKLYKIPTLACHVRTFIYWHGEIKKKNELFKNFKLV